MALSISPPRAGAPGTPEATLVLRQTDASRGVGAVTTRVDVRIRFPLCDLAQLPSWPQKPMSDSETLRPGVV